MIIKYLKRFILVIAVTVIIIPAFLYLPPIQKWAFAKGIEIASESTGWDISTEEISLSFPLRVSLKNLLVKEEGDTVIYVSSFKTKIAPLQLLRTHVEAYTAAASGIVYNMNAPDSSMNISARVNYCVIDGLDFGLRNMQVDINEANIEGGNVDIYFNPNIVHKKDDNDNSTTGVIINAQYVAINSLKYNMQMLPAIDSLDVSLIHAELHQGYVNTGTFDVNAKYLLVDGVDAIYKLPSADYVATHSVEADVNSVEPVSDSILWTIKGEKIELRNASGIYAISGTSHSAGFDINYIQVDSVGFVVDNFYNRGTELKVPVKHIYARERSGLNIVTGSALFEMDSMKMQLHDFNVSTFSASAFRVNTVVENGVFAQNPTSKFSIDATGEINVNDLNALFPSYSSYICRIGDNNVNLRADVSGTLSDLSIDTLGINIHNVANLLVKGNVKELMSPKKRIGNLSLAGNTWNLNRFKSIFFDKSTAAHYNLIATSMGGKINMRGDMYGADFKFSAGGGAALLAGAVNLANEEYKIDIDATELPIDKVMPESNFGTLTAEVGAEGKGFNPLSTDAYSVANINISSVGYNGYSYKDITSDININNGRGELYVKSDDEALDFTLYAQTTLPDDKYEYQAEVDVSNIDLKTLNFAVDTLWMRGKLFADGFIDLKKPIYSINLKLKDIESQLGLRTINSSEANVEFKSDSVTTLHAWERDFNMYADSKCSLDTLIDKIGATEALVSNQIENRIIKFDTLSRCLPEFSVNVAMGRNNVVNEYMKQCDMGVYSARLDIQKTDRLGFNMNVNKFMFSGITLDTISIEGNQVDENLFYNVKLINKPGNLDQFAYTNLYGKIGDNTANILLNQHNRKGDTGFKFGLGATFEANDEIRVNIFPENPVIGYRKWTINKDNYIEYQPTTQHVDANVELLSDAGYVSLHTDHVNDSVQENIVFKAVGVNLSEWLNVSPFMPKIGGMLNANASVTRNDSGFEGQGAVDLSDLVYNRKNIGTIDFNVDLSTDSAGNNIATAGVEIGGKKAITVSGVLGAKNDSIENSMNYKLSIDSLPLAIANPFVPQGIFELNGYLSGNATMRGTKDMPLVNGTLYCDSTSVKLPMFGSRLAFGSEHIDIKNNNVVFDDFNIIGINNNPITINGNVNLAPMSNPMFDLSIEGENVQVIDSKYTSRSQVFGKAYINLSAYAEGRMNHLNTRAFLDILPKTDVTYVLQDDVSSLARNRDTEMVKFVNFSDTTDMYVEEEIPESFNMDLNAILNVQQGSMVNVNLSPDGKNKVQISGAGTLTYNMNANGDGRLSGRYTINNGFVRYYPPFISEKYFTFVPGSYVAFNGDMMNPTLSITAIGNQSTTVLTTGANPMRVKFEITASVTNTLKNMNVDFDLAAPNNSYIESELQSSSAAQRSAQAINLMLYGTYSSGQTSTANATNANMLYSLLSSQLNNFASKVVKGVDISFGINQYNMSNSSSAGGTGMNYSYSVSKSLFDNRFKMTVGGNYDTNESSDISVAQNLFSNISFEYLLNQSGTMSLQLYNKVTDNNIYQTQVNETGLAFTLRRKISNLMDVFRNVKSRIVMLKNRNKHIEDNAEDSDDLGESK